MPAPGFMGGQGLAPGVMLPGMPMALPGLPKMGPGAMPMMVNPMMQAMQRPMVGGGAMMHMMPNMMVPGMMMSQTGVDSNNPCDC